ncbi:hypothetical protein HKX48_003886 [Thoreauomyces humboldtii]|nr:hypothetical protein HKX48_003886 [Thoreauomyces humboldtii]
MAKPSLAQGPNPGQRIQPHFRFVQQTPETNTNDPSVASNLFHATLGILRQYSDLLEVFEKDPDGTRKYTQPSNYVLRSTVGKHVRHVVDHFRILLTETIAAAHEPNISLNYDERNPSQDISASPQIAATQLRQLRKQIRRLEGSAVQLDTPVSIGVTVSPEVDRDAVFASSLGREIWVLCHHAIHHAALIRAICVEYHIPVEDSFGVAPSTQKHKEEKKAEKSRL